MKEMYKRVFLVDTENQGTLYLKDLGTLMETDLVICVSTEYSPKFTYTQLESFLNCKAKFQFVNCQAGTPNALDFQLSTLLGYMCKQDEEDDKKTEFIILSKDTGYYGIVSYWSSRGFKVGIRNEIVGKCVDVDGALAHLNKFKISKANEVALGKAELNKAGKEAVSQVVQKAASSAIDKFNKRMEATNKIKEREGEKTVQKVVTKPNDRVIDLGDLNKLNLTTIEKHKDEIQETREEDELSILGAGNKGSIYNRIINKYSPIPDIYDKIEKNATKIAKFTKKDVVESTIIGFVIYVSKDTEDVKKNLLKVLSGDSRTLTLNTIIKRVKQKHFYNKYEV